MEHVARSGVSEQQAQQASLVRPDLMDLPAPRARLDPLGLMVLRVRPDLLERVQRDQRASQDLRGRLVLALGERLGRLDRPGLQDPRAQASPGRPDLPERMAQRVRLDHAVQRVREGRKAAPERPAQKATPTRAPAQ